MIKSKYYLNLNQISDLEDMRIDKITNKIVEYELCLIAVNINKNGSKILKIKQCLSYLKFLNINYQILK